MWNKLLSLLRPSSPEKAYEERTPNMITDSTLVNENANPIGLEKANSPVNIIEEPIIENKPEKKRVYSPKQAKLIAI